MTQELAQLPGVLVGELAGVDSQGQPLVRGAGGPARAARVVWMADSPDWATCAGCRVVFGLVDGDEEQPVVLGLLDAPPRHHAASRSKPEVLRIESGKELVIECGQAKIALRSDGRIEIRGGHLISRSSGPNKIKGGSVHIN